MDNIDIYSSDNMISEKHFEEMYNILVDSFPSSERRSKAGHLAEFSIPYFRSLCYGTYEVSALMNYWEFDDFIFLEHFAVSKSSRCNGLGTAMMREFSVLAGGKPIILEAEPPKSGELSERRIKFYNRLGFVLNEYEYWQPSLQEGELPVRLMLMSSPNALTNEDFCSVRDTLYKFVYCKYGL